MHRIPVHESLEFPLITNQYYYTNKYLLWILFCCKIKFAANVCVFNPIIGGISIFVDAC